MVNHTIQIDGQDYVLTFNEDFDAQNYYFGHGGGGIWNTSYRPHLDDTRWISRNGEQQYYVDADDTALPQPFTISGGELTLNASELTPSQQALAAGQPYGSGLLTTELSFGLGAGYVEIRADVPDEQGLLSAFWLLPADGDWTSEIDVFEILGSDPTKLHTNVWNNGTGNQQTITTSDLSTGYHTYGLKWDDTTISWLLDGVVVRTTPNTVTEDMYLALSLMVGTTWTGDPDQTTDFTDGLKVDYLRVYELDSDPDRNDAIPVGQTEFIPQQIYDGTTGDDTLYGTHWSDMLTGHAGADQLHGRAGDDFLMGVTGADSLFGGAGNDILEGGSEDDQLVGGDGDDTLEGGEGTDHLWGGDFSAGSGADHFVFSTGSGKDYVHDFDTADDVIDLSSFATDWASLNPHLQDQGWATYLNLGHLGGAWTDMIFLIGVSANDLTAANFDFGAGV